MLIVTNKHVILGIQSLESKENIQLDYPLKLLMLLIGF